MLEFPVQYGAHTEHQRQRIEFCDDGHVIWQFGPAGAFLPWKTGLDDIDRMLVFALFALDHICLWNLMPAAGRSPRLRPATW